MERLCILDGIDAYTPANSHCTLLHHQRQAPLINNTFIYLVLFKTSYKSSSLHGDFFLCAGAMSPRGNNGCLTGLGSVSVSFQPVTDSDMSRNISSFLPLGLTPFHLIV